MDPGCPPTCKVLQVACCLLMGRPHPLWHGRILIAYGVTAPYEFPKHPYWCSALSKLGVANTPMCPSALPF